MADDPAPQPTPPPPSIVDQWLHVLRLMGLAGILGGFVALVAFMRVTEFPADLCDGQAMVDAMRAIFYSTVFAGILILVPVGAILWLRHRPAVRGRRWFRAMMILLILAIPALHITARTSSRALQAAVEAGDFALAQTLWERMTWLFTIAFFVFLGATALAQVKPRLGQQR